MAGRKRGIVPTQSVETLEFVPDRSSLKPTLVPTRRVVVNYSVEVGDEVCRLVSLGKTLRWIGDQPGLPSRMAITAWRLAYPAFAERYNEARAACYDTWADEIISISDDGSGDSYIDAKTGVEKVDWENVQRSRLRCDSRKWLLSKLCPVKYADLVKSEVTGTGGAPINFVMKLVAPTTTPK